MHIVRVGFTPLKGGRHTSHPAVELTDTGPVGDRVFCLVDPARGRVLRTVQNPTLLQATAGWNAGELTVDLADVRVHGVPEETGERLEVDYWGRAATVEVVAGPWAAAYSSHLGYPVVLARSAHPGDVVYGASVTLVSTSSIRTLEARIGHRVDSARFRSTLLVDTGDEEGHVEDTWTGRTLRVGAAEVTVRGVVPRCAVVDLDPVTGQRDADVLKTLAGYRRGEAEINFGVDAVVTHPGRVRHGDPVSVTDDRVSSGRD